MFSISRQVLPVQCNMIGVRFKELKLTHTPLPTKVDRTFIIGPNVKYIEYDDQERRISIAYMNGTYMDLYDDENFVGIKHTYKNIVDRLDIVEHQDYESFVFK